MLYLSQFLNSPIYDKDGVLIGKVDDLAINTKEVFPSIVALSFKDGDDTVHMISWTDNIDNFNFGEKSDGIKLKESMDDLERIHLKDNELFLERDLLGKQIVDVKNKKVARVSDLKLSADGTELRLLGAECGLFGRLHFMSGLKASFTRSWAAITGKNIAEDLIAWNYIDIPSRDMSRLELSMSHKRLTQLRPADIADIIEQLEPKARTTIFAYLDRDDAADTAANVMGELEDDYQSDVIESLDSEHAVSLLSKMEPDDATDILSGLNYEKAEKMLQLMGIEDAEMIRILMGYRKNSAGGIMTPAVAVATEEMTVAETIYYLRHLIAGTDDLYYVYLVDEADENGLPIVNSRLLGVVTLLELLLQDSAKKLGEFAHYDVVSTSPDEDQETVAEVIAKYNLLALPVIDKDGYLLGTITVDDVVDVMGKAAKGDGADFASESKEDYLAHKNKDGSTSIGAETAGDEVRGILGKIVSGIHWILPQNLSWVMIWLVSSLLIYVGQINLFAHINTLDMEALGWNLPATVQVLNLTLEVAQISLLILPLILLTICGSILRSAELLTSKTYLAPSAFMRYSTAIVIAIGHTFVSYLILILSIAAMGRASTLEEFWIRFTESFTNLTLLIFIPLLCALLICALFAAWRIGVATSAHKAGTKIHPKRIATATMLIFVLTFTSLTYPAAWAWNEQIIRAQEAAMMNENQSGGESGEVIDLGEALLEDGEYIYLEDLLGEQDFNEVESE